MGINTGCSVHECQLFPCSKTANITIIITKPKKNKGMICNRKYGMAAPNCKGINW